MIILKYTVEKWDKETWAGSVWLTIETEGGFFVCGNEPFIFIKCGKFF
jgi:hypothetical protein